MIGSCYRGAPRARTAAAVVHYQPANDAHRDYRSSPHEVLRDGSPGALSDYFAPALRLLYREYESPGGHSRVVTSPPGDGLLISGSRVAVAIKVAFPPALGGYYISDLQADGLRVFRTVPAYGLAEGMVPIAKLPAITPLVAHVWPAPPSLQDWSLASAASRTRSPSWPGISAAAPCWSWAAPSGDARCRRKG